MIYQGIKLSCIPCLKGHRSAHCPHHERALVEVKKKGRPRTQCEACSAKRLKTGGHVRCNCPRAEERPPLEFPHGVDPSLTDLPLVTPLVRNTSTSSSVSSSSSSRAPSVPAETQESLVRKKSLCSTTKRKDPTTVPHNLAHGGAAHHHASCAPYHAPPPHCRSAPMTRAPSTASSCDHSASNMELPPLPHLFSAAAGFQLPPPPPPPTSNGELDLGVELGGDDGLKEFMASLDPKYWPGVGCGLAEVSGSVGEEQWNATSSSGSVGGGSSEEIGYPSTTTMPAEFGGAGATSWDGSEFDLSSAIDEWRQVLELDPPALYPPTIPLPPLVPNAPNAEWIAPNFTDEPTFYPPPPLELAYTSSAFDFGRPYPSSYPLTTYDDTFFPSSSSSSKAACSVAGSDVSSSRTPPLSTLGGGSGGGGGGGGNCCPSSQLSLSLADFDLSLHCAGGGGGGMYAAEGKMRVGGEEEVFVPVQGGAVKVEV